ncbi:MULTISPECIES: integrase core domain-containing protein, partial [unclassified Paracoccus (in: a-proteobacteria)]|uniref:integrase core domain-containing protein n=1 Tax=unclassified Paracoccus (in: a-proteobacteria) TaxID=2688777 RepID=UPI001FFE222D
GVVRKTTIETRDPVMAACCAILVAAQAAITFNGALFPTCYGPSYIAGELAEYIEANKMSHVRGAPCHPQTQGKIERWHQTLKNRILLENYFLPGDLEAQIEAFVEHYNHQRYHESLNNVTPADAYFGRAPAILQQRERIKRKTLEYRRLQHRKLAA